MKVLSFNTGLEQVITDAPAPAGDFPLQKYLPPSGDGIISHIRELFEGNTVERQLEEFARPRIAGDDLLTAGGFSRQYHAVCGLLQALGERSAHTPDEIYRAVELLEEYKNNADLLSVYRTLLLQA